MAMLTMFYGQQAAAQTSACPAPPASATPPSNMYPTTANISLNLSNQSISLPAVSLITNLASQPVVSSTSGGISPITINSANGACSNSYPVLIQNWCSDPTGDVLQFQGETAQEFLSLFHIPAADGPTALQILTSRANTKLLNSYFGFTLAEIEALLTADPASLTQHQANIVGWFNGLVWQNEKNLYSAADQEKNNFLRNPCGYTPDSDLAAQYNLQFNINQCTGAGAMLGNPNLPPLGYFLAVGLKKSYGTAVAATPDGAALNYGMLIEKDFFVRLAFEMGSGLKTAWGDAENQLLNAGITSAAGLGTFASSTLFFGSASVGRSILPFAYRQAYVPAIKGGKFSEDTNFERSLGRTGNASNAVETAVQDAEGAAEEGFSGEADLVGLAGDFADAALPTTLATAGPAAVVAIFVAILSEAIDQLESYEQAMSDYASLDLRQASIQTQSVNAASLIGNQTGEYKLAATLATVALPLVAIPATLPDETAQPGVAFRITNASNNVTIKSSVTLADWNLLPETLALEGAWFSETEQAGSAPAIVSRTPVIHYLDWNGRQWWAARFGDAFLAVKNGYEHQDEGDQFQDTGACGDGTPSPMSDDQLFQAQQASSGVQNAYCSSFVTHELHVKDNNGNQLTLQIGAIPQISSGTTSANATFQPGQNVRYNVPFSGGYPTPTVSVTGLPKGFTSTTLADGTLEIIDTNLTATTASTGTVTIAAANSFGTASLNINVTEKPGSAIPSITGPSQLNLQGGKQFAARFSVTGDAGYQLTSLNYTSNLSQFSPFPLGSGTITGLKVSFNSDSSFNISGVPVLQVSSGNFPPNLPITGAITISATASFFTALGGLQGSNITQSFPFTYTPSVDPFYAISNPIVMYNGLDNEALVQPVTPTGSPTFSNVTYAGDAGCASFVLLIANYYDGSLILSSKNQGTGLQRCFISFTAQIPGDLEPPGANIIQPIVTIPIIFLTIPKFTNIANPVFPVGLPATFNLTTTSPASVTYAGTLPAGLQFTPSSSGGAITGTPAAGSGGEYKVTFTAKGNDGSSAQILDIKVPEAPKITSTPFVNVPFGQTYTFNVTTTGYPNLSSDPCGGMNFVLQPLGGTTPVSSQASNQNVASNSTGTLKLTFPNVNTSQAGSAVLINASNSAGSTSQEMIIRYLPPGDANGDGVVNCTDYDAVRAYMGQAVTVTNWVLDLTNDGVIDAKDLAIVSANLATGTVCH
jgi:hypothetical protein